MPRIARVSAGGVIYHVLNRGNNRQRLFHKAGDGRAFLDILADVKRAVPMRVLGYCLMPNHWHLVLLPLHDGDLSRFMLRLTTTHVRRYYKHYAHDAGGHLYQGRFKNFPVEDDHHLLTLLRYVEANPCRAGLVARAEDWKWSSLHLRHHTLPHDGLLDPLPIDLPADWAATVNDVLPAPDLSALRTCLTRGRPFGSPAWTTATARRLGLSFTLRPPGRPKRGHSSLAAQHALPDPAPIAS
jgi:putative transposase